MLQAEEQGGLQDNSLSMASAPPRLRILSVGGNAVSAFLSWRLQATNACDVTLVWKAGHDTVSQYGISIKSQSIGNERFKPYQVVRTPEEAAQSSKIPFDYVVLCVKALPDVYDLASIIESVVTPQHTCILLNTTNSIGVEEYLEQRYSTNVVLSLVCGADLQQTGAAEFEHKGDSADMWVGWANENSNIPESIQKDMAEALAMTLSTAQVSCLVSLNIRQQQLEKMIGPIAFHPVSVLFNNPNIGQLYEMPGVAVMINGIIDELLELAKAYGCDIPADYRDRTVESMRNGTDHTSVMYSDYQARRPMEVETFLGSPIRMAKHCGVTLPRIEVLYALLHDKNQKNLKGEAPPSPTQQQSQHPPPRTSSMSTAQINGMKGPRPVGPPRRGPPPNGFPPRMPNGSLNGYHLSQFSRRGSMEGNDLEEFSHVMLYENVPDGGFQDGSSGSFGEPSAGTPSSGELAMRERELQIRQREIELREREQGMHMRRGPPPRGPPPRQRAPPVGVYDDEDDEDDYFDPMSGGRPPMGPVDDNIDMLSITSRRHRKTPSGPPNGNRMYSQPNASRSSKNVFGRKNRSSTRLMQDVPSPHESIRNNPLLGYSSNRYGTVDRQTLEAESRHGSMTNARMEELSRTQGGAYPSMPPPMRRSSQSPGNPLSPNGQRPSPPNGYANGMRNGSMPGQRPSPPGGVRQPIPRHPPGHGNAVAPHQVEQHAGVSTLYPPKPMHSGNLTGKLSGNTKLGANTLLGSSTENSASSSSSSLQPRNLLTHVRV